MWILFKISSGKSSSGKSILASTFDNIFKSPSLSELNLSELLPDIILIACCLCISVSDDIRSEIKKSSDKNINLKKTKYPDEIFSLAQKSLLLQIIDQSWKEHLLSLDHLRQGISLRAYGQRDPLVEYKKEAFSLFSNLLDKLKLDFITILMNLKIVEKDSLKSSEKKREDIVNNPKCLLILKKGQKISRNEKCEATGKKFKNCCGAL